MVSSDSQASQRSHQNFASVKCFNYSQSDEETQENDAITFQRDQKIEKEISILANLLSSKDSVKACGKFKTAKFWSDHREEMTNLFELQIILLNIPSTSSFIERFFSLSGIICDERR